MIIATLSPSILAVDESFSTLNYAQKAQGITNKPVATSYLQARATDGRWQMIDEADARL